MDKFEIASSLFKAYRYSFEKYENLKYACSLSADYFKGQCEGIRNVAIFLDVVDLLDNAIALYEMRGCYHE